jgi:23S rRNA G2069 N7-methylase RlmK/C1962 C5-methylase RlmI
MARLEIVCDPTLNGRSPGGFPCRISATGRSGQHFEAEVLDPPGFSRHGLDAVAVESKFHALTRDVLSHAARTRIVDCVTKLEHDTSCHLIDALAVRPLDVDTRAAS